MVVKAFEVEVKVKKVFCWSDSHIPIWWICQFGKKNVAVENWYHMPTKLNPATISSGKAELQWKIVVEWSRFFVKCCREMAVTGV